MARRRKGHRGAGEIQVQVTVWRAAAIALAMAVAVVGLWRGTWAVGGSDSSCYALMAQALARGQLQPTSDLASSAPWPNASTTFAPGGFIPSPVAEGAASPVCAPGFSLILAPFHRVGGPDAIFAVVPLAGALLVYFTFSFATRLAGEVAGLAAAILVASMPVFIFQIVQPMNDVLVAMLCVLLVAVAASRRERPVLLGALAGLVMLIRPNLAPAVALVGLWCTRGGWRAALMFALAAAPFLTILLGWNWWLYGRPFGSGYGDMGSLFALSNLSANLVNYGRSLWMTQLAFPLLGLAAFVLAPRDRRLVIVLATGMAVVIMLVYLLYRPLPEWWYLRFLLPSLAILSALSVAVLAFVTRRAWVALAVASVVAAFAMTSPAMRDALDVTRLERRFRTTAAVARERLPENAAFVTVWESGSLRYHADRPAVLWDSLDPASLDEALEWLQTRGHEPFIVVEDWEEPLFRQRFAAHSLPGQLDWPPLYDIERRVRIYRPADRGRFWQGETIPTEFVWPNRR
jgi:hypothetical protein